MDVAYFFHQGFIGIGAIIRVATGMVCVAMGKYINGLFEPLIAELLALRKSIYFALRKGFVIQFAESDSQLAIGLVNSTDGLFSNDLIIRDVKSLLRSCKGKSYHFAPDLEMK
ncbi:Ribonuclease H-like domain containing protein [Parasponia andersonii]|uniref:Ribonuclease H-like domain containing protein n=1 Tax=Parasponia andersonii TaxID=3476 RepID=A0A2P5BYM1_PARAD|nr:Ribonuclease H-like domain containing protein [Parasponia andersonii]